MSSVTTLKNRMTEKEKQCQEGTEDIFRELCICNGLSYEKIALEGSKVTKLEMFFSGYSQMVGLLYFPNLVILTLVKQDIKRIEGLEACPFLIELWIIESQLTEIEGLECCTNLRRLYLYYNHINEIKNLESLEKLEILWLNNNNIKAVKGLNTLKHLKELNLAANSIEKIGTCLDSNIQLERLNLSGNRISSFKELTNLSRLPMLQMLGLKDPQYNPNPISLLCNYSTHIIYHIPQLRWLDTYDVSSKQIKDFAESTVLKKIMYYNMRVKMIQQMMSEILEKLQKQKCASNRIPEERIKTVSLCLKNLECELNELQLTKHQNPTMALGNCLKNKESKEEQYNSNSAFVDGLGDATMEQKLCHKLDALRERLKVWNKKFDENETSYEKEIKQTMESHDFSIQYLLIELETVGNVRFEEGTPSDVWYSSCHDVISSRFCIWDFKTLGVTELKINRIVRVHNRILRLKYEEKIHTLLNKDGTSNMSRNYKKLLEYLFYVFDPQHSSGMNEMLHILQDGFKSAESYKVLGRDEAVPLSNSISLCEYPRIEYLKRQAEAQSKIYTDPVPFKYGQIIIAKVFLGHSVQTQDSGIVLQKNYPKTNSVYRPRKMEKPESASTLKLHSGCDCSLRQYEWFVFDHELVVPEYVINFEYVTPDNPQLFVSTFSENNTTQRNSAKLDALKSRHAKALDEEIVNMEPVMKSRPKVISLDEKTMLSVAKAAVLSQITVLSLHGNSLSKLKGISKLINLQKLTVSFNELLHLDDLSHLVRPDRHLTHLEYVDVSHNHLVSLDGFKGMERLKYLDLSWNQLTSLKEEIGTLRKHSPGLVTLNLRHNPWQKKPGFSRIIVLEQLKSLTCLNGVNVTEDEPAVFSRMTAGPRITQVLLLINSRSDKIQPRYLNLMSCAQMLTKFSKCKPNPSLEQNSSWLAKISAINLDGQNISRITNLERLVNLRWASFNSNIIRKIEGLDRCLHLEELSLENNCITKLEGISKLTMLTRLNLASNQLSNLEDSGLDKLVYLHHLSMENNQICSLRCFRKVNSIIELYLANNQINNNCEIYYLKGLENLVILDLYRNPLVNTQENYRPFIIYHLPALKALDGQAVEQTECENAKDVFGGRLTSDMIAEKLGYSNVSELLKLDLPDYAIRTVDLGPPKKFEHLQRINLERNNLTSFSGLIFLPTVKALYLNYNHIESIFPRQKSQLHLTNRQLLQQKVTSSGYGQQTKGIRDVGVYGLLPPVMESLEVLHLAYNGISNLAQLELSRLTNLRTLFLQGNNITQIEGLDGLRYLVELVLNRNRIKMINANSFWSQGALVELHLEENRIRELNYLNPLVKLQRLFLGANKIQDIFSLEKLDGLSNLTELSMIDNPVTRKILYRPFLLFRLPRLQLLDGLAVTYEERERSELQLCEQNLLTPSSPMEMTLPGLVAQLARPSPLRVTNVTLQAGVQHLIGQEFNVPHTFGDSISQEAAKNKKYKHLAANLVSNMRGAHVENALRQIKSGSNYQPSSFAQQQGGASRNMHTFTHTQEQDGRVHNNAASKPSRM